MVQKLQDINFNIEMYNKKEVDELLSTATDNLLSSISNLSSNSTWKDVIEDNTVIGTLTRPKLIRDINGNTLAEIANYGISLNNFNNESQDEYTSLTLNKNLQNKTNQAALYYRNYDASSHIENSLIVNKHGIEVKGKPLTIPEPLSNNHATTKAYVDNALLSLSSDQIKYDIISYSGDELSLQLNSADFYRNNASTLGYKLKVSDFIYYKPEIAELDHCVLTSLVINSLSITNGNSGTGLNTNPLYCVISEFDHSKQDINNGVKFIGVSNNSQNNTANTIMNFQFDGVEIEPDKLYIITFVLDNQISNIQTSDFQTVRLSLVQIPNDISSIVTHDYIGQNIRPNGSIYFMGDGNYTGNCSAVFYPKYNKIANVTVLDYNISETVHTFGNEIISGEKTFIDEINFKQSDFSDELKDSVLENYNINYPNITTTSSLQNIGNILSSEKYTYIRPEENRMFDSTTVVMQVNINKDTITNIPTELTSNIYSIDQKRLVQFELWSAGSFYVTALNTNNHSSNPNKISTRMINNYSTPTEIPDSKKLLIVWRFTHNSDTSMTIQSFINGNSTLGPITVTNPAKSMNIAFFKDINEDDPDWTIEKFEIYDKALTDEEIQNLQFYSINKSLKLTPEGIFYTNTNKTKFKDGEYITKNYVDNIIPNIKADILSSINITDISCLQIYTNKLSVESLSNIYINNQTLENNLNNLYTTKEEQIQLSSDIINTINNQLSVSTLSCKQLSSDFIYINNLENFEIGNTNLSDIISNNIKTQIYNQVNDITTEILSNFSESDLSCQTIYTDELSIKTLNSIYVNGNLLEDSLSNIFITRNEYSNISNDILTNIISTDLSIGIDEVSCDQLSINYIHINDLENFKVGNTNLSDIINNAITNTNSIQTFSLDNNIITCENIVTQTLSVANINAISANGSQLIPQLDDKYLTYTKYKNIKNAAQDAIIQLSALSDNENITNILINFLNSFI